MHLNRLLLATTIFHAELILKQIKVHKKTPCCHNFHKYPYKNSFTTIFSYLYVNICYFMKYEHKVNKKELYINCIIYPHFCKRHYVARIKWKFCVFHSILLI